MNVPSMAAEVPMSSFLVTYDIQKSTMDPHAKVLAKASDYGWYNFHRDHYNNFAYLPNTTLSGYFDNLNQAQQKFLDLVQFARQQCHGVLDLEKYLVTRMGDEFFSSNKPLD